MRRKSNVVYDFRTLRVGRPHRFSIPQSNTKVAVFLDSLRGAAGMAAAFVECFNAAALATLIRLFCKVGVWLGSHFPAVGTQRVA